MLELLLAKLTVFAMICDERLRSWEMLGAQISEA